MVGRELRVDGDAEQAALALGTDAGRQVERGVGHQRAALGDAQLPGLGGDQQPAVRGEGEGGGLRQGRDQRVGEAPGKVAARLAAGRTASTAAKARPTTVVVRIVTRLPARADPQPVASRAIVAAVPREIVLARHGETEWSRDGRHTGRTDIPLTETGPRAGASCWAARSSEWSFARVLSSPLERALETCRLAGLGERGETTEDLLEWDYGEYEGITTPQIRESRPDWNLWRDGCPGGETAADVGRRVDRVIAALDGLDGDVGAVRPRPRAAGAGGALDRPGARRRVRCSRSARARSRCSATSARRAWSGGGTRRLAARDHRADERDQRDEQPERCRPACARGGSRRPRTPRRSAAPGSRPTRGRRSSPASTSTASQTSIQNSRPSSAITSSADRHDHRVDRLAPLLLPVDVLEVQPERELVHRQAHADAEARWPRARATGCRCRS